MSFFKRLFNTEPEKQIKPDPPAPITRAFDKLDYIWFNETEYNELLDKYDDDSVLGMVNRIDFILSCIQAEVSEYSDDYTFEFKKTLPIRNENMAGNNSKKGRYVWTINSDDAQIGPVFLSLTNFKQDGRFGCRLYINQDATYAINIAGRTDQKDTLINGGWTSKDKAIEFIDTALSHAFTPAFKRILRLAKKKREKAYHAEQRMNGQDYTDNDIV